MKYFILYSHIIILYYIYLYFMQNHIESYSMYSPIMKYSIHFIVHLLKIIIICRNMNGCLMNSIIKLNLRFIEAMSSSWPCLIRQFGCHICPVTGGGVVKTMQLLPQTFLFNGCSTERIQDNIFVFLPVTGLRVRGRSGFRTWLWRNHTHPLTLLCLYISIVLVHKKTLGLSYWLSFKDFFG